MFMAKKKEKDPERELYYLLPGMARGARARYLRNLKVSLVVGVMVSAVIAFVFYYLSHKDQF